jgi:hypothetical protein
MSSAHVPPFDVERYNKRRSHRWVFVLIGFAIGFVTGTVFILYGVHRSWGLM